MSVLQYTLYYAVVVFLIMVYLPQIETLVTDAVPSLGEEMSDGHTYFAVYFWTLIGFSVLPVVGGWILHLLGHKVKID